VTAAHLQHLAILRYIDILNNNKNNTRPDSLETKAPYKFFTYFTYLLNNNNKTINDVLVQRDVELLVLENYRF